MSEPIHCVPDDTVVTGWDFSTTAVKCLAFNLDGKTLDQVRIPTDLLTDRHGLSELNLALLEGQARMSTRGIVALLRHMGMLERWQVGGISATHHTAGRIDANKVQVRRAICWNDETLARYHEIGLQRLGGQERVRQLIGGPWAIRYSLSHLVKDEAVLSREDWQRTEKILLHGPLAAGFLTGNFEVTSVSSAASTGIMDLRTLQWRREMLDALESPELRELAWIQLPRIIEQSEPIGTLADSLAIELGLREDHRPMIFPTSDDQQAGLVGGGAVDEGQLAIILGSSAVVNSSGKNPPEGDDLDAMRLNWGPYLWMRCYQNGAQFLNAVFGEDADWAALEREARKHPAGCNGTMVLPFVRFEPSLGIKEPRVEWFPSEPESMGVKFRACLEALAYLIALGVRAHKEAGLSDGGRWTVSGGIANNDLMCEILVSVLSHELVRLESFEGPALGAAVTALAALETYLRRQQGIDAPFTVADAVAKMVKFRDPPVRPNPEWIEAYEKGLRDFEDRL